GSLLTLILFRAVQGLGAGGLIVLAQTSLADLVSPRERGRYQGLFAAVFTTCSVAGPLLGGFITEYASWRWIFYVNLPIGAVALALIVSGLPKRVPGPAPKLDYLGALVMMAGTSCLLLLLSWGGNTYAWTSVPILLLAAVALTCLVVLVLVERRAMQPVFPPDLFRNRTFVTAAIVLSLAAMALFSAVVFLPLMFQLLMGASPLVAGLMIAPLMGGVITASTLTGRLVARTGRYKMLPVIGLFIATTCYFLLSWAVRASIGVPPIEVILAALGLGMGSTMPNLTTGVQNAVARSQLGAATASAAFFRSLGGALGVAMAGAVVAVYLHDFMPGGWHAPSSGVLQLSSLSATERDAILSAYRTGLSAAFTVGAIIAALGFLIALTLPDRPLQPRQQG
ncbi:MAG TPA: MFS transporter, partial [Stellaceae bacterium]|nr:MFS transporter [Stellaceae bacterium]